MTRRTLRNCLVAAPSLVLMALLAACTATGSPDGGETVTRTVPGETGAASPAATSPRADGSARPPGEPRTTSPTEVVTAS